MNNRVMNRQRFLASRVRWFCPLLMVLLLLPLPPAQAKNIGGDPPAKCPTCPTCAKCNSPSSASPSGTSSSLSLTEGNMAEVVPSSSTKSSAGPTMAFNPVYNSYNADGSRATIDTVMGYGWSHTYNIFLFTQLGAMFRYDGNGRVTKYGVGAGGTYVTSTGYFETLVKSGVNYILSQKDHTVYTFASITGNPILVGGPVWMLTKIVDRNGNTTSLTYTAGKLSGVTDTYGRTTTFAYNSLSKVSSVTDPAGRVTTFQYDSTGHKLTNITDPNGNTIQYTYNTQYQITGKTDKAGRTFTYSYNSAFEPTAVNDSGGGTSATLSNPGNWATNAASLASNVMRVYTPATTSATDGKGNVWKYQYDSNGYLLQTTAPDSSTTTYTYDPATLMLSSKTDADGNTTSYQYDGQGNRIKTTDALGNVTTYTYEPNFNMMTSMTDPLHRVTTYTIDPATGNQTKETDPLGNSSTWTYDSHGNTLTYADKNGHTFTYQYDASGDRIQTTDPLGNITAMTYDGVGNMLSVTDPDGHTTQYQYDGMNRLTRETDATGHFTQTVYDGEGNRIQSTDRNGRTTTYQYDLRQRLITTTDPLGHTDTYTYDPNNNRLSMTDRDGHTTAYAYDLQNRMIKTTDAVGDITSGTYDGVGNTITATDANGHITTFTYDALNRRTGMTDALGEVTTYQYDTGTFAGCSPTCGATPGSSLITGQIDPDGNAHTHSGVIYYKYDALNRQIDVVQKVGSTADTIVAGTDAVTTTTYDAVGNRLTQTEPDGNTTTGTYDADNRIITVVNAAGDTTTTTYDPAGNVITVTAPNLDVVTNTYDALNRLTQATDSAGSIGTYTYDPVGNRLTSEDGNTNTTSYGYDAINRLVTTTDPLGKTTTTVYDPVGNPLQTTDRNGNLTTYTYDGINRRITATDALGNVTQSQYDPVGNLHILTDANLHVTLYAYDAVNRRTTETYADSTARSYTYDGVGNLLTRTDQNGKTTNYTYNDLYFLTARTYPSAVNDAFTYDLSGRTLTAQRGSWPVTVSYDGADRITQTVQNTGTISYVYNVTGRKRIVTYPGGRVITESTDARNRISQIDDVTSPPSIAQYSYDPGNRVTNRNYRNLTTTTFAYNADNWILNLQHSNSVPLPIAGFTYAYDNEGNKQFENKLQDSARSEAYQYDAAYRLITYQVGTLSGSTVPVPNTQTNYNLDAVGNWIGTNNPVTSSSQTRVHNSTNELTQINSTALTYDSNGNLLNDGTYTYAYDEENRLTQINQTVGSALVGQYQYDAMGRRVQKIAYPGATSTTVYFYDGMKAIEEQAALGSTQATYVYGNNIDEVLTMNRGGNSFYYHHNALGSVEAITNSAGAPVERYEYDAYGAVSVLDGSFNPVASNLWGTPHSAIGNPYTFTGRQLDEEAGLYFYRARYYDAAKGRFLQRDSVEYRDGMNLYEYAQDNPTRNTDPSGKNTWYVRTIVSWDTEGYYWGWYGSWSFKGYTKNFAKFDTQDCCKLNFQESIDRSDDSWKGHIYGRFWDVTHSFNTKAVGHVSSGACRCQGKDVDGVEVNVYHVYSTGDTVDITLGASAGVEVGINQNAKVSAGVNASVTIPKSQYTSSLLWTYLVCPTGGANSEPSVKDKGTVGPKNGVVKVVDDLKHKATPFDGEPSVWDRPN